MKNIILSSSRITKSSKNQNQYFVLVDDNNFEELSKYNWYFNNGYAMRDVTKNKIKTTILMHRLISECPEGLFVDHINGNRLDNRRQNLRFCNYNQNTKNRKKQLGFSSIYKGVSWFKRDKCWTAHITYNYKNFNLGYFYNELHAAMAYDIAARDLFKDFAKLNFEKCLIS